MATKQHKILRPNGRKQGRLKTSDEPSSRPRGPTSKKELRGAQSARADSHRWRSILQIECKGLSLTLGLPFAIVLGMIVLVHADWSKIGGHINFRLYGPHHRWARYSAKAMETLGADLRRGQPVQSRSLRKPDMDSRSTS